MITIDYKDRTPIYEQLIAGITDLVVRGALKQDDQLPSVRQLAGQLAINPNTIQKAYTELERQGITYSLKGRGCFIASNVSDLRLLERRRLLGELRELLGELKGLDAAQGEVLAVVSEIYGKEQNDD